MSKDLRHGRWVIPLPAGWRDESTVVIASDDGDTLTLAHQPAEAQSADAYLELESRLLREQGLPVEHHHTFDLAIDGRPGRCEERTVEVDGVRVRQLAAAAFVEGEVLLATASTPEVHAEARREGLLALLAAVCVDAFES